MIQQNVNINLVNLSCRVVPDYQEAPFNCVKYVLRMIKIFALSRAGIFCVRHVSQHGKSTRRDR